VDKIIERLKNDLKDEEARFAYAEAVTNTFLTAQIKALQEQRELTQEKLAELVGTQQSGISRWLNSGFSSCKVESLRKFARAYGVRLRISFEEFGTLPTDVGGFSKERLAPRKFEDDPVFNPQKEQEPEKAAAASHFGLGSLKDLGTGNISLDTYERIREVNAQMQRDAVEAIRRYGQQSEAGLSIQQLAGYGGNGPGVTLKEYLESQPPPPEPVSDRSKKLFVVPAVVLGAVPPRMSQSLRLPDVPNRKRA